MRLRCGCGRNLADVTAADNPAGFTVTARASMRTWSPMEASLPMEPVAGDSTPMEPAAPTSRPDWHATTYAFTCRCGQRPQVRAGVLFNHWSHRQHERGVVTCILGFDL